MAVGPLTHFNARRALRDASAIWKHARWCTTPEIRKTARLIVERLKKSDISDARIIDLPADGRTSVGGWVMPKAWDVKAATLTVVDPSVSRPVLADYRKSPMTLMLWSPPTPPRGVTAEVVLVKDPATHRGNLRGKLVLPATPGRSLMTHIQQLARRGAAGFISDFVVPDPGVKEGPYLDDASQYGNYVNPCWDAGRRLPAFSITPRRGRMLRELIARHGKVRVNACVASRLYDGRIPLVSAALPGVDEREILLTGHMDEPGASDNASGVAVSMEILRALAAWVKKRGRPLRHTVRIMFSGEVRGIQGYLNLHGHHAPVIAGLNLDMVGASHRKARSSLYIESARPFSPSFLDALLGELVRKEAKRPPLFRYRHHRAVVVDDCQFAALPFAAPMCFVGQPHERTYHTSLDTPDVLSAAHMKRIGRMACETVRFVADADGEEISALAHRTCARAAADVRAGRLSRADAVSDTEKILGGLNGLIDDGPDFPTPDEVTDMRRKKKLVGGVLYPKAAFAAECGKLIRRLAGAKDRKRPVAVKVKDTRAVKEARSLVPVKRFAGYFAWEDLSDARRKALLRHTGMGAGWGPAEWLQMALDLSNGKNSLEEICLAIARDGVQVDVGTAVDVMRFLARDGKVAFRNIIGKQDIQRALKRVGIRPGNVVVAHTSLSGFGYVRGGTDTMIDALCAAVGRAGTLAVPTHSLSWLGRQPYDPKTSPSLVGEVTNAFLRRRGVKRSMHPTHSVAALGPIARRLLAGHDHTVAPQGREGFWGNLHDADGTVLLMCPPRANTILHAAEIWAGMPYPPARAHYLKKGRRIEVTIPGMPWHVDHFDIVHDRLIRSGRMRSAALGEGTIYAVRARDAVAACTRLVRSNPRVVLPKGCRCRFCRYVSKGLR